MTVLVAIAAGIVSGLHAATWGAYKDAPYEGLRWTSLLRSPVVATVAAILLWILIPALREAGLVVFVGVVYTAERLSVEWWKSFIRNDDQRAYSIPMRFGYRGTPINHALTRYCVGLSVALGFIAICWTGAAAQGLLAALPTGVFVALAGIGGWFIAAGGAWKDAPIEGFHVYKFLRSPIVATLWAWPLAMLSSNWALVTLAAGGFSVASIETYKTYWTRGQAPGKFATMPVRFAFARARTILTWIHAGAWSGLVVALLWNIPWANAGSPGILVADEYAQTLITATSAGAAVMVLISVIRRDAAGRCANSPAATPDSYALSRPSTANSGLRPK